MEDIEFYTCKYCFKEYEPKRRRVQKYCSNTCRSKAYFARSKKNKKQQITLKDVNNPLTKTPSKGKIDAMTPAGIGNAAAGVLAADAVKSLLTHNDNKPATKGDLKVLLEKLKGRYHLVKNIPQNHLGQYAYYDLVEGLLVYFKPISSPI